MRKPLLLAVAALAMARPGFAAQSGGTPVQDPLAGWIPRKVTREEHDRKELDALCKALDEARRRGDVDGAAALVDFPVLMVTDDAGGEAIAESWGRDRWVQVMRPFYGQPRQDVRITHNPMVFLLTDSLAVVEDEVSVTRDDGKVITRSATLLVRKAGRWKIKSMAQGGWGDVARRSPAPQPGTPRGPGAGPR